MKVQTTIRVEEDALKASREILAQLGLNYSEAVNIFTRMIVQYQGLPFQVKIPNAETQKAMQAVRNGEVEPFSIESLKSELE